MGRGGYAFQDNQRVKFEILVRRVAGVLDKEQNWNPLIKVSE